MFDDHHCLRNDRCDLDDGHQGPCGRYVQHDSMCGCTCCAREAEGRPISGPRFDFRPFNTR